MKHRLSITLILLGMFLLTQLIGLFVVNAYMPEVHTVIDPLTGLQTNISIGVQLPFGLETPDQEPTTNLLSIFFAFVIAFALIFFLMKYKWKFVIKAWFFFVVTIALGISLNAIINNWIIASSTVALAISIPLAFIKIFRPHVLVHNLTELLIYPGIAAVFVPLLNPTTIIILLILISIYDMWAVWKSGIMQKMAKFQMEELKIFGGFLIPSVSSKVKAQIKKIKQRYKGKKMPKRVRNRKFKINLAILGGGDVIFPIITAGVFMKFYGLAPAIFTIFGALAGLSFLFIITKKGKAYPAMPYISAGIFAGLILWKIFM